MTWTHRLRRAAAPALTALAALAFTACAGDYPNSTFLHTTDFNRDIDALWDKLLLLGTIVFVLVEAILIYTIFRFRRKPGQAEPKHVHGNTTLEILWTAIPAVILVFIAVPTVTTIFRTQAKAVPTALQVEVIGHQWWWEFRYPEFTSRNAAGKLDTLVTANELYLPLGRTVNFTLRTADVLHSFWIPRLGGKRDLITNHTNYLWFTVDSIQNSEAMNGSCNEYCGTSHANMKFRAYVVQPAEFALWTAHQQTAAAFVAGTPGATPPASAPAVAAETAATGMTSRLSSRSPSTVAGTSAAGTAAAGSAAMPAPSGSMAVQASAGPWSFPRERMPDYTVPKTPLPPGLDFPAGLAGDPTRGQQAFLLGGCIGCHKVKGNPFAVGVSGPNLTHIGSRNTIAAGLYPNDTEHLARWVKNARLMKPGSIMPTLGLNEYDPIRKIRITAGGLTDQQIADVVAYLQALK